MEKYKFDERNGLWYEIRHRKLLIQRSFTKKQTSRNRYVFRCGLCGLLNKCECYITFP